jgi:hypothetical protein
MCLCGVLSILYPINNLMTESRALTTVSNNRPVEKPTEPTDDERVEKWVSPRDHTGSWIGNTWIPPAEWRYYPPTDLRKLWQNKTVMWFGDSTARRASMTMYAILNSTNSLLLSEIEKASIIDVNKKRVIEPCRKYPKNNATDISPRICRPMPGSPENDFIYIGRPCLKSLIGFVENELDGDSKMTENLDVMIVSLGVWYGDRPWDCRRPNRTSVMDVEDAVHVLHQLLEVRPNLQVIWRTSGWSSSNKNLATIREMNNVTIDLINREGTSRMSVVDWGSAVEQRSFGAARIQGDMKPHYGFEPRHVLIQMISNILLNSQRSVR